MWYTFPMSSDSITCFQATNISILPCWSNIFTLPLVWGQGITTGLFNGFIYLIVYPLRFHHRCEYRTHPEAPSCALWVPVITVLATPSHGFAIVGSANVPTVCHYSFPAQLVGTPRLDSTTYYAKPYPYEAHGCTIFTRGRSINRSLDLGMITNHMLLALHWTKPWTIGIAPK
jgi:hypothetical protein